MEKYGQKFETRDIENQKIATEESDDQEKRKEEKYLLSNDFIADLLEETKFLETTCGTEEYRTARNKFFLKIFAKLNKLDLGGNVLETLSQFDSNDNSVNYIYSHRRQDMSKELIEAIDRCHKSYSADRAEFSRYLNSSIKRAQSRRLVEKGALKKGETLRISPKIRKLARSLKNFMADHGIDSLSKQQLENLAKCGYEGAKKSELVLAYQLVSIKYISAVIDEDGEETIEIPIVDEYFQDGDEIYLEYYEKFSGLIQTMSDKKSNTCRAVSTNLFYGAWWWTFSKERKTFHRDFAKQHDVLHQDVYARCEEVPRETKRNDAGWLKSSSVAKIIGKDNAVISNMTKEIGAYLESKKK